MTQRIGKPPFFALNAIEGSWGGRKALPREVRLGLGVTVWRTGEGTSFRLGWGHTWAGEENEIGR